MTCSQKSRKLTRFTGAVGVEFASEVKLHFSETRVVLVHSRQEVLSNEPLPSEFKKRSLQRLHDLGVETMLCRRLVECKQCLRPDKVRKYTQLTLDNGHSFQADVVIDTTKKHIPNTDFLARTWLGEQAYIPVMKRLDQSCCRDSDTNLVQSSVPAKLPKQQLPLRHWRCHRMVRHQKGWRSLIHGPICGN